jgi:methylmalonyl-CoA/ethylmalonyl-CoA epimerase
MFVVAVVIGSSGGTEMLVGVDHVGVAVKSLDDAVRLYRDVLGFRLEGVQALPDRKVKTAFFSSGGETRIELLEPLGIDSPVAKFLEKRGEGIHHIAVKIRGIEAALEKLRDSGVVLVDEKPRPDAEGKKIAFVHPKSTKGVLLELVEKP